MRISDIEIAERYSRSRVSPAVTPMRGLEVKKQCCNDPNPFRLDHDGDPSRALSYLSLPFISPVFCLLSFFSLSPFLSHLLVPFSPPSGENSSACLYVVWSRATRHNATPGCIVNQTHGRQPDDVDNTTTAVHDDI